jgi:predicted ABC-type ATPase
VADRAEPPCIYVIAGTNGAGKSSIAGATFRQHGVEVFDPDAAARRIASRLPGVGAVEVNSAAWHEGRRLLERAIAERLSFAFETTLGGTTMTGLLERALEAGLEVRVWYVGLDSPERNLARVRARVARGGHDIPEATVRRRYHTSRLNLVRLLPRLTELRVWDNSVEADPAAGATPAPRLLLHARRGRLVTSCPPGDTPAWAKPIVAAALKASSR